MHLVAKLMGRVGAVFEFALPANRHSEGCTILCLVERVNL
jgi:hypothetical protein